MGDSPALCITAEAWRLMTAEPPVPTKPADDDVLIWEYIDVSGSHFVTGWDVSAGNDFPMRPYTAKKEAYKAAREFAVGRGRDIWVIRAVRPPQPLPRLLERHRPPT